MVEVGQLEKPIPFPPIEDVLSSRGKIKILKVLVFEDEINISAIVRLTRLNNSTVNQHLAYFKGVGIVQEKIFGRTKIYQLNPHNRNAQAIRKLIEQWPYASIFGLNVEEEV